MPEYTPDKLEETPRLTLRKWAMKEGMDRTTSATKSKPELVEFLLDLGGNGASKKKSRRGKVGPKPLTEEEKQAKEAAEAPEEEAPKKTRGKATKKTNDRKADAEVSETSPSDLSDMINRLDAIGTAIDTLEKLIVGKKGMAEQVNFLVARFDEHEASFGLVKDAVFWIYNGAWEEATRWEDIKRAPSVEEEGED